MTDPETASPSPDRGFNWRLIGAARPWAVLVLWFVGGVFLTIAVPALGQTANDFVTLLTAATLLAICPEGPRGWLLALGAALAAGATGVAGMLSAQWAGASLGLENVGLWALIHLAAAAPPLALSFGLARLPGLRAPVKEPPPEDVSEEDEAMTTREFAWGCLAMAPVAVLFMSSVGFAGDLLEQFHGTVFALAGYKAEYNDSGPGQIIMLAITGLWLFAHRENRPARNAIIAVIMVVLIAPFLLFPIKPWFVGLIAPDPDIWLNGLARVVTSLLPMGTWLLALLWIARKYGLNAEDGENTDNTPATQEAKP